MFDDLASVLAYLRAAPAPPPGDWVKPIIEAFVLAFAAGLFLRWFL